MIDALICTIYKALHQEENNKKKGSRPLFIGETHIFANVESIPGLIYQHVVSKLDRWIKRDCVQKPFERISVFKIRQHKLSSGCFRPRTPYIFPHLPVNF